MARRIMLGVPCFAEGYEMLLHALQSFVQPDVDVVAVDNGGTPYVKGAIADMGDSIATIHNAKNVYINPAWNQLAERFLHSDAELLVVANADLVAAPGWSASLLARYDESDRSEREFWFASLTLSKEAASSRPSTSSSATMEGPNSRGSFFAMTREAASIAFPVPEELLIWYGDDWIFTSLHAAGFRDVTLADLVVWHAGGVSSYQLPERTAITDRERDLWNTRLGALAIERGRAAMEKTMDAIERRYVEYRDTPADINEHMPVLLDYAKKCERVTEFGVGQFGRSTWALLHARPERMRSYDIGSPDTIAQSQAAADAGIDFGFVQASTLSITIDETDLLFIDTLHTFAQLREELRLHAAKTRKFIVMHDTTLFGDYGEDGSRPGLWAAVEEFLYWNRDWHLVSRLTNNNGLTILERR